VESRRLSLRDPADADSQEAHSGNEGTSSAPFKPGKKRSRKRSKGRFATFVRLRVNERFLDTDTIHILVNHGPTLGACERP
jgi:hypothetical protein